jgi:hypothetical protein
MKARNEIEVKVLPKCSLCFDGTKAHYDARTLFGSWAYLCNNHFVLHRGKLGVGYGQEFIVKKRGKN